MVNPEDHFQKFRIEDTNKRKYTIGWIIIGISIIIAVCLWIFSGAFNKYKLLFAGELNKQKTNAQILLEKKPIELAVIFLDIGQGDSILVITPDNYVALIDGGEGKYPDNKYTRVVDAGNKVILPFLRENNIKRIDLIINTHPHSDHCGGLIDVIKAEDIEIGGVMISGFENPTPSYKRFLKAIKRRGLKVRTPKKLGEKIPEFGDKVVAKILWGVPKYWKKVKNSSPNNSSVSIKLKYGNISFILCGDDEREAEKEIVYLWGKSLRANVYKASHHGSKTSSSQEFLEYVKPQYCAIQVGAYNSFGHPAPITLKHLNKIGAEVYRNDQQGHIFCLTDGEDIKITTQK